MMIVNIEDFFIKGCGRCKRFDTPDCSIQFWQVGLNNLRSICLDMGLVETVKWAHPCYMHSGRNIAIFGAFRGDFRLNFMNAALLKDPDGILEKQGENTQYPNMIRFTDSMQVKKLEPIIRQYLAVAMDYAKNGILPEKIVTELVLPDELIEVLDADPELAEAFHSLPPGRQKSYALNLNSAKAAQTRFNRIEKFRPKIIAGKGATER